jgi:hypothetical protein
MCENINDKPRILSKIPFLKSRKFYIYTVDQTMSFLLFGKRKLYTSLKGIKNILNEDNIEYPILHLADDNIDYQKYTVSYALPSHLHMFASFTEISDLNLWGIGSITYFGYCPKKIYTYEI